MQNKYINTFLKLSLASLAVFVSAVAPNSFVLPTPQPIPVMAEAETGEANYKILVAAEFEGQRIGGLIFTVTGTSTSKQLASSNTAATEFAELAAGTYNVSVAVPSSSEYEISSSAGNRSVTLSESKQIETVTFQLTKKAPARDENIDKVKAIKLPAELTKIGSTTTDFSKLDETKLNAVEKFTFDNPGVNKIVYKDNLDFSNFDNIGRIGQIADYIDLENYGEVIFNTEFLAAFNKAATITMSKVRLVENFDEGPVARILKDGRDSDDVTNVRYTGTDLSFDVKGFSTYALAPRVRIDLEELESTDNSSQSGNLSETQLGNFVSEKNSFELKMLFDNLDAVVNVTNNGEIVNIGNTPDNNGEIKGTLPLTAGSNRIRVVATIPNDQKVEQFFTVTYTPPATDANPVSNTFAILFFVIILIGGLILGGYYYRQRQQRLKSGVKNSKVKAKKIDNTDPLTTETEKNNYNPALLTPEEKELYDVKSDDETSIGKEETQENE